MLQRPDEQPVGEGEEGEGRGKRKRERVVETKGWEVSGHSKSTKKYNEVT